MTLSPVFYGIVGEAADFHWSSLKMVGLHKFGISDESTDATKNYSFFLMTSCVGCETQYSSQKFIFSIIHEVGVDLFYVFERSMHSLCILIKDILIKDVRT